MLATVASVTSAGRIKRRVYELGINTSVIQTPQTLAKDGCGYSIRFSDSDMNIILRTANEMGIRIRAFYIESVVDGKRIYSKVENN